MTPALRMIAWRFMLKGTERGRFSAMTFFAWAAIGVGVGTMSSLLSVMYGLESSMRENVLKAYPHVIVRRLSNAASGANESELTKKLLALPDVVRAMPYVETEMIAQSDSRTVGAVIWGVPDSEWPRIKQGMQQGEVPAADSKTVQGVLGSELAAHLRADTGDTLSLISPIRRTGALGSVPKTHTVEVSGLYESGHYEFDKQYLFIPIADAKDFVGKGNVISGWHVWAEDLDQADTVAKEISKILPQGWQAQSWTKFNEALFHSLKLEQFSMFLILSFAIVIAVMNVAITLMMHVSHKRKNIGILRALGASENQVRQIFILQGTFLGGIGLLLGAVLSVVLLYYIEHNYRFPDIYYHQTVPIEIRPYSIATVYLVATVLIFLATLYPAAKAAEQNPIEAIRE